MVQVLGLYLLIGLLFGAYFVVRGHASIDSSAQGASIWVRLLWLPASIALWPVLIKRLMKGAP